MQEEEIATTVENKTTLPPQENIPSPGLEDNGTVATEELYSSASSRLSLFSSDEEEERNKSAQEKTLASEAANSHESHPPVLVHVPEEGPKEAALTPASLKETTPSLKESLPSLPSQAVARPASQPLPPSRPPPLPARARHRRTSSALPRLETLDEEKPSVPEEKKPPRPPRHVSFASSPKVFGATSSSSTASSLTRSQSYRKLPEYPATTAIPPRMTHRRTLSAPSKQPENFLDVSALKQQLKQLQQQYGENHAMVATTWNWLGNAYFRQGNNEAALQAYKKAVLCEPGEHLADAYANIGTCYWTSGNVEEAIPFLQNALAVHEYNVMSRGQDPNTSPAVAGVQYQLGLALTLHQDYEEALFSLHQARAIRERILGHDHMDVARTLDAIGKAYLFQGQPEAALDCHLQALDIKARLAIGFSRSAMANTMMNIVSVHRSMNNLPEAGTWMHRLIAAQKKEFLAVKTKVLCAEIGVSLSVLGEIYDRATQYKEGLACYREANMYFDKAHVPTDDLRRATVNRRLAAQRAAQL